jgi:hypothetical protein
MTANKKRTRVCPSYQTMWQDTKTENDRLRVELEHTRKQLRLEQDYSDKLAELLRKGGKQS